MLRGDQIARIWLCVQVEGINDHSADTAANLSLSLHKSDAGGFPRRNQFLFD